MVLFLRSIKFAGTVASAPAVVNCYKSLREKRKICVCFLMSRRDKISVEIKGIQT